MSARGFGSVLWAGAVAGAALGFYLVSLRVASERAALEDVETQIAMTQRDIRSLQTEIGTRGRLAQLERWNVKFIRLSAPTADQFVDGGFQLATLVAPPRKSQLEAPVVMASATVEDDRSQPRLGGDADERASTSMSQSPSRTASELVHVASYSMPDRAAPSAASPRPVTEARQKPRPVTPAPATKPVKTATADPLAPLSVAKPRAKGDAPGASAGSNPKRQTKDSDSD
jgi:hypothetical protein